MEATPLPSIIGFDPDNERYPLLFDFFLPNYLHGCFVKESGSSATMRYDDELNTLYKRLLTASRILLKSLICERNERQTLTGNEHKYHKPKSGFGNALTG